MTIDPLGLAARPERGFAAQPQPARASGVADTAAIAAPPAPTPAAAPEGKAADTAGSTDALNEAVSKLNASVHAQSLEFSIDEDSKRTIVKVIDSETKEVVRQLPTKEALEIAKSLDKAFGLLIRQQA